MKKFLAILFSIILTISICVSAGCNNTGCNKNIVENEETDNTTPETGEERTGIDKETVVDYIVKDNASVFNIVIPSQTDECISYAAEELQRYVNLVSNVTIPIIKDTSVKGGLNSASISLGKTILLDSANLDIPYETFNYEGFIIKTINNMMIIDGAQSVGVLYGVYDFCENFLGIEFLAEDYTYIPHSTEIKLFKTERIQIPAFAHRDYLSYQTMLMPDFAATMRMNSTYALNSPAKYGEGGLHINYVGEGHTNHFLLPYEEYGAAHPDWFVNAGAELCYTNGITDDGEVDLTNTNSMAYTLLQICKEKILQNPYGRYLTLGQHDNADWCSCERCRQSDIANGGASGTIMVFINAMAKALDEWKAQEHIDRVINVVTFAYWKTEAPPVKVVNGVTVPYSEKVKARDNVVIRFAHMSCAYHALTDTTCSVNNSRFYDELKGWKVIANNFSIWDYATNFTDYFYWYPNFGSLQSNYRYYKEIGVNNVMTQGPTNVSTYYQTRLNMYVTSKLQWNPKRDVNELVSRFNKYYFGEELGKKIDYFVMLFNSQYAILDKELAGGFHTDVFDGGNFKNAELYSKNFLETLSKMIEDEIDAVENDSTLSAAEKDSLRKKLLGVYLTPQYMLLRGSDSYYNLETQTALAKKVFGIIDELQIRNHAELFTINDLKAEYGIG